MKVSRVLCSIALVGLSLGLSAAVAHADGADPKLKMGGGTGSPFGYSTGGQQLAGISPNRQFQFGLKLMF